MGIRRFLFLLLLPAAFLSGCATEQVTKGSFTDQYLGLSAKVDEAEMLGARECAPRELANVRVELDRVNHETRETHYPLAWVQAEFDKVGTAADKLLETRRLRASQGQCP